jgi:hypothetical protein
MLDLEGGVRDFIFITTEGRGLIEVPKESEPSISEDAFQETHISVIQTSRD